MVEVTRRLRFCAAHHLPEYAGRCAAQHGHNFVAELTVQGEPHPGPGEHAGMVIDFKEIDALWRLEIEPLLDHTDLNVTLAAQLGGLPPTTEVVAMWLLRTFRNFGVPATRVRLWETENNSATAIAST